MKFRRKSCVAEEMCETKVHSGFLEVQEWARLRTSSAEGQKLGGSSHGSTAVLKSGHKMRRLRESHKVTGSSQEYVITEATREESVSRGRKR